MTSGASWWPMAELPTQTAFITGFPRLLARGLVRRCLNLGADNRAFLLVDPDDREDAQQFLTHLPPEHRDRVALFHGRTSDVDLGLTGPEVVKVLDEVTLVFQACGRQVGSRSELHRRNVSSLNTLLTLARDMGRLRRFSFFSTAFVSGDRSGVVHEEDLDRDQRFRTPYERSMFVAEHLARAMMPRLPITVLRPASMIGHSRTGESHGLTEGPNYLVRLMVRLPAEVPFFLPGSGVVPFNIVPIDYVVRAAWALATAPEAEGRTFHLTDPNPVSARQAFELLGDLANRPAPFTGQLPMRLLRETLRMTGLGRLAPQQMALLEDLTHSVIYDCSGALEILADAGVVCPPFESYADILVAWVAQYERNARREVA